MTLLNNAVNNNEEEKGLSGLLGRLDSQGLLAFAAALQEQAAPSTTPQGGLRLAAPMLAYKQVNEQQKQKQALNQLFESRGIPTDLPTDVALKLLNNSKQTKPNFQTFQNTSSQPINIGGRIIEPNATFNIDSNTFYDPQNQAIANAYSRGLITPFTPKNKNQQVSFKNFTNTSGDDITLSNGIVIKSGESTALNVSDVFASPNRGVTKELINKGILRESGKIDIKDKSYINNTTKPIKLTNGTELGVGQTITLDSNSQIQNNKLIDDNKLAFYEGGRATNKTILQDPETGSRYEQYNVDGREFIRDLKQGQRLPLEIFRKLYPKLLPKLKSITTTEIAERSVKRPKLLDMSQDIVTDYVSLQALTRYGASVDKAGQGINFAVDSLLRNINTILDAEDLTEEELAAGLATGQQEGLLGKYRLEVVGGGVMTEQDAMRVIKALGRRGALRNKQEIKVLLTQMFKDKYAKYARQVQFFNTAISDQQDDAFLPFPVYESYEEMLKELTENAEVEQFSVESEFD